MNQLLKPAFNTLGRLSKLTPVPASLDEVTDRGEEVAESGVGLKPGTADALWQRMESLYATGVQPGLQLCVMHQGQVVLDRAIGHARGNMDGQGVPMRRDTPVNLFSAAKAVTAMLVHKLDELGYFSIDDRVARHIPGFERHGKQDIRIRDILAHRAALTRLPSTDDEFVNLKHLHNPDALHEMVLDLRPQGKINRSPSYHAISGGFVMAELMRQTTGEEPRDLLDQYIKQPLGLGWLDFGVKADDLDKVALNQESGWVPGPIAWHLGRIVGAPFAEAIRISNDPVFLSAVIPSGNVLSTARDMARFYTCLLNHGEWEGQKVFEASTVRQALKSVHNSKMPSLDRTIGIPIRYSPGFMLGHKGIGLYGWNRVSTFGHFGFTSTLTWARPDTGTAIALLTNGKPVLGPHIVEMLGMFAGLNALCENRLVR